MDMDRACNFIRHPNRRAYSLLSGLKADSRGDPQNNLVDHIGTVPLYCLDHKKNLRRCKKAKRNKSGRAAKIQRDIQTDKETEKDNKESEGHSENSATAQNTKTKRQKIRKIQEGKP